MSNTAKGRLSDLAESCAECHPEPPLADDLLWGGRAIAAELGIKERRAFYLLNTRAIPAEKVNGIWVGSRRKLRKRLVG